MATKTVRTIQKEIEAELREKRPGAIARLADLYRQLTVARLRRLGVAPGRRPAVRGGTNQVEVKR